MKALQTAIIKTLCYADIFDYPLTSAQIHRYLIYPTPTNPQDISQTLHHLASRGAIGLHQDYYFLPGRKDLTQDMAIKQKHSQQKLVKARQIAQKIKKVPGVSAVLLTGALAMENAAEDDDIDILIITKAHRLWITRALVTLFLDRLGVRRHPKSLSVSDLICPNLYLDETALAVPSTKRDLYTAHEVIQAKPLVDKTGAHHRFLVANTWIRHYLPNALPQDLAKVSPPKFKLSLFIKILEKLAYSSQYLYMLRHRTNETVTSHSAYFHPQKTKNIVLEQYNLRLVQYLG
jgi:predicted nucleotidyltransferase